MNRLAPITLLLVIEDWLSCCSTFVKWLGLVSFSFNLTSGVHQRGLEERDIEEQRSRINSRRKKEEKTEERRWQIYVRRNSTGNVV